jgi:hypothetical protein
MAKNNGYIASNDCRLQRKIRNFQEQCFLMDLWSAGKVINYKTTRLNPGPSASKLQPIKITPNERQDYKNFTMLEASNIDQVYKLFSFVKDSNAAVISKLRPVHLSALLPYFRLYKYAHPNGRDKKGISMPFYFPDHLRASDGVQTFKEALLQNKPMGNIGFKGFNWTLKGTDEATRDLNIEASLSLFLQQLGDLEHESPQPAAVEKLIAKNKLKRPRYLDLLLPNNLKGPKVNALSSLEIDSVYFEVRAVVGWNLPSNYKKIFIGFTKQEIDELASILKNSRKVLRLQMIDHDIKFKQDGTVNLDIKYQAGFEGLLSDPDANIFSSKEVKRVTDLNARKQKSHLNEIKKLKRQSDKGKINEKDKKKLSNKAKKISEEFHKQIQKLSADTYSKIIRQMEENYRIFDLDIDVEAVGATWQKGKMFQSQTSALEKNVLKGSAAIRRKYIRELNKNWKDYLTQKLDVNQLLKLRCNYLGIDPKNAKKNAGKGKFAFLNFPRSGFIRRSGRKNEKPKYILSFFFLGDLIDSVLEIIKENLKDNDNRSLQDLNILLGPVKFFDPLKFNGTGRPPGGFVTANIADIPISYEIFRRWFLESIIKRNKKTYTLREFFQDMATSLLRTALKGGCYDYLLMGQSVVTMGLDNFTSKIKLEKLNPVNSRIELTDANIKKLKKSMVFDGNPDKFKDFALFYISNSVTKNRTGSMKSDLRDGIYHFFIGSSTGILKTLDFSKENWQYYKESRMVDGKGIDALGQPYRAKLSVIPIIYFKPGQIIYINPRRAGMNKKISTALLLEGYYQILNVSHSINESGKYEASFDAIYFAGPNTGNTIESKILKLDVAKVPKLERSQQNMNKTLANALKTGLRGIHTPGTPNLRKGIVKINKKKINKKKTKKTGANPQ